MANIKKVASIAGVSTATVSRTLKKPELVNYAIKSDVLLNFLRGTGVRLNLNRPYQAVTRGGFADVVKRTEPACVLILVY